MSYSEDRQGRGGAPDAAAARSARSERALVSEATAGS
jgi:hypothetical protein